MQLASNPVLLNLNKDPKWEQSAIAAYSSGYDRLCHSDDSAKVNFEACFDLAQRITFLDTVDSLAFEIKVVDGKSHGWDNGFLEAIERSSYPTKRYRLMMQRLQDPDFQPSRSTIESLIVWELQLESPQIFQSSPELSHDLALEKMRKFVRLLGDSLAAKDGDGRKQSETTYHDLANENYCAEEPLISAEEQEQAMATHDLAPN